jgi:hypothetical protein
MPATRVNNGYCDWSPHHMVPPPKVPKNSTSSTHQNKQVQQISYIK